MCWGPVRPCTGASAAATGSEGMADGLVGRWLCCVRTARVWEARWPAPLKEGLRPLPAVPIADMAHVEGRAEAGGPCWGMSLYLVPVRSRPCVPDPWPDKNHPQSTLHLGYHYFFSSFCSLCIYKCRAPASSTCSRSLPPLVRTYVNSGQPSSGAGHDEEASQTDISRAPVAQEGWACHRHERLWQDPARIHPGRQGPGGDWRVPASPSVLREARRMVVHWQLAPCPCVHDVWVGMLVAAAHRPWLSRGAERQWQRRTSKPTSTRVPGEPPALTDDGNLFAVPALPLPLPVQDARRYHVSLQVLAPGQVPGLAAAAYPSPEYRPDQVRGVCGWGGRWG